MEATIKERLTFMIILLKPNHRETRLCQLVALIWSVSMLTISCEKDSDDDYKMTNQEFVTKVSSSNNFEIAAGNLAQTKGTNGSVKLYGQHIVTEHITTGKQLKSMTDRKSWTVSTTLMADHQQSLQILNAASTAEFDIKFAQLMVRSHEEAVSLFQTAAAKGGVPDVELRSLAAAKLPTLKAHLQKALTLQNTVNPISAVPAGKEINVIKDLF